MRDFFLEKSSLCFGAVTSTGLVYLSDLLKVYTPSRQRRSSADSHILCIPPVNTKSYGKRSFSYIAPTLWNTLPKEIKILSACSCKSVLKTHLFPQHDTDCVRSMCVFQCGVRACARARLSYQDQVISYFQTQMRYVYSFIEDNVGRPTIHSLFFYLFPPPPPPVFRAPVLPFGIRASMIWSRFWEMQN